MQAGVIEVGADFPSFLVKHTDPDLKKKMHERKNRNLLPQVP